ncbi:MAG: hypothetical protein BGN88_02450 [Clostridiales bacterium 43-6]|nr:MAG: hypothetical protein BGN88_02450 [Clostridiales bacterium 43-6]
MKNGCFEGWYFKQNTKDGGYAVAFIVGRARDKKGEAHSFIQINQSQLPNTFYIRFPEEIFSMKDNPLEIRIGNNVFGEQGILFHHEDDAMQISAQLIFDHVAKIKKSMLQPDIMGIFSYLPFLECYHSVHSLHHVTKGSVSINESVYGFDEGSGYIEGDKGKSFPAGHIWLQSNHFHEEFPVSVVCAVAHVPVLFRTIKGFLCVLYIDGKEYRFATYNHGKIHRIEKQGQTVKIELSRGDLRLCMRVSSQDGGLLKAPGHGDMSHNLKENINAVVKVALTEGGKTVFEGTGMNTGFEMNCFDL